MVWVNTKACMISWITHIADVQENTPQKVTVMTDVLKLYKRSPEGKSPYPLTPSETLL